MISYLKGNIIHKQDNYLVLKANNIGYKVFVSAKVSDEININHEKEFFVYQQVGEQVLSLFGLSSFNELSFFEMLISVSGIGPKTALGVMDIASVVDIQSSILAGDSKLLSQASGIGKKTAERVVLELRNKVSKLNIDFKQEGDGQPLMSEEIDALIALGYTMLEARDALSDADSLDSTERIKQALKSLSSN